MKIQDLFESSYPSKINAADLVKLVQKIHHSERDFNEGNIVDRIYQYKTYTRKKMKVSDLRSDYLVNDELVHQYEHMNIEDMPPLIWDPVNEDMIDGTHRLEALKKLNIKKIDVYVGDKSTYEPIENSEE